MCPRCYPKKTGGKKKKKEEAASHINSLNVHIKELEKEEQSTMEASAREERIKIGMEIKQGRVRKKTDDVRSWFFEKDQQNG